MQKLLLILVILFLLFATGVLILALPLFSTPELTSWGNPGDRSLLQRVPDDAEEIVFVPRFATFFWAAQKNAVVARALAALPQDQMRYAPWLLGNADVVAWRRDKRWSFVARPDALHRGLISAAGASQRGLVMDGEFVSSGEMVPRTDRPDQPFDAALIDSAKGQFFVWQSEDSSWSFPPIARPAFSAGIVKSDSLEISSRSGHEAGQGPGAGGQLTQSPALSIPTSAMISAVVSEVPEILSAADRLFPVNLERLFSEGGGLVLYDLEADGVVPRPRGVLVVPASDANRQIINGLFESVPDEMIARILGSDASERMAGSLRVRRRELAGVTAESTEDANQILLAFDNTSLDLFLASPRGPATLVSGEVWRCRIEPNSFLPVVKELRDNKLLKLAARDTYRKVDRFYQSVKLFADAESLELSLRTATYGQQLQTLVRIPK